MPQELLHPSLRFLQVLALLPFQLARTLYRKSLFLAPPPLISLSWKLQDARFQPLYEALLKKLPTPNRLLVLDAPTEYFSKALRGKCALTSLRSNPLLYAHAIRFLKKHHLNRTVHCEFYQNAIYFPKNFFDAALLFLATPPLISSVLYSLKKNGKILWVRQGRGKTKPGSSHLSWKKTTYFNLSLGKVTLYEGFKR